MIEIIGYITLYLLIGIIMLPFAMLVDEILKAEKKRASFPFFIVFWPLTSIFSIFIILTVGWMKFKNYK